MGNVGAGGRRMEGMRLRRKMLRSKKGVIEITGTDGAQERADYIDSMLDVFEHETPVIQPKPSRQQRRAAEAKARKKGKR